MHGPAALLQGEHSDEEYPEPQPARRARNFSLVPHGADYSPDELLDQAQFMAFLSAAKLKKEAPVLYYLRVYDAKKKRAQAEVDSVMSSMTREGLERAITSVKQASFGYLRLLTHVFDTISGPDASPVGPSREQRDYQRVCVKYKVLALEARGGHVRNQRLLHTPVTWSCVMPWSVARDTVNTKLHEMHWRNIYAAIHESCPRHNTKVSRLRGLLHRALKDTFFAAAEKYANLAARAEPPESTLDTTRFHWTATDALGHTHTLMAGGLDVRHCPDYMIRQVFTRFRTHVLSAARAHADGLVTNLFTLALTIDAPATEGAHERERHVLEISPYAGEDACTVCHIFLDSLQRPEKANGFMPVDGLPEMDNVIRHKGNPAGEMSEAQGMTCIGAHRGVRFGEVDLLKVHAQGHEHFWWGQDRPPLHDQTSEQACAARVSIDDWDFVFSSFTGPTRVKSVITAVHYPPYMLGPERAAPLQRVPRVMQVREGGVVEPFFVHMVAGDETSASYQDEERHFLYYFPFLKQHGALAAGKMILTPYLQGLDAVEQEFQRIKKAVSVQFASQWPPRTKLHRAILALSRKRGASSALHMWASQWRAVVWRSMSEMYEHDQRAPDRTPEAFTLLAFGHWQLSQSIPEHERRRLWVDLLVGGGCPSADEAGRVYDWYAGEFLPRELPGGVPAYRAPRSEPGDSSSESGTGAPIQAPQRGGHPMLARLAQLEQRLGRTEQDANVKHLLDRVLQRLEA